MLSALRFSCYDLVFCSINASCLCSWSALCFCYAMISWISLQPHSLLLWSNGMLHAYGMLSTFRFWCYDLMECFMLCSWNAALFASAHELLSSCGMKSCHDSLCTLNLSSFDLSECYVMLCYDLFCFDLIRNVLMLFECFLCLDSLSLYDMLCFSKQYACNHSSNVSSVCSEFQFFLLSSLVTVSSNSVSHECRSKLSRVSDILTTSINSRNPFT